jgi:hypothetical protein
MYGCSIWDRCTRAVGFMERGIGIGIVIGIFYLGYGRITVI